MARKKSQRKEAFFSFPNAYGHETKQAGTWREKFGNDHSLTLELGCGKAEFGFEMAKTFPGRNFLGIDLKPDRMWVPAKQALEEGIHNLKFMCLHLSHIQEHFAENEADEIWITFPDPFPKKRQAKHRMINPPFLDMYKQILAPHGRLYFKTDNLELFQYSLEVFVKYPGIHMHDLSFDLHGNEDLPAFTKFKTTYEKKFLDMGKTINFVVVSFS